MLKMSTGVFPFSGFCTWQEIVGVAPELTNLELVSFTKNFRFWPGCSLAPYESVMF